MPVNWQNPETKDRLLAAIIASHGCTINCKEVARIFGNDATYDAIENFLRKPKKLAKQILQEAPDVHAPTAPKPRTPRKPKAKGEAATPKPSPTKGVMNGRVTKPTANKASPTKKSIVKKEMSDEDIFNSQASNEQIDAEGDDEMEV